MTSIAIVVVKSIFLCLFILLAVVGNASVIYVVNRVRKLKTIPNYFVVNLAVADLLFALTGMPMILVTTIAQGWILGPALCKIGGFLNSLFCLVSIWTLAMISVNRYFAVAKATTVQDIYTKKRTKILVGIVWLWGVAIACPPLFGWSRFKAGTNFCTIDGQKHMSYSMMMVFVAYFVPLFILAGLYCRIFFMLRDHQRNLRLGKFPTFPSYGAADEDTSTIYSDSDSVDSSHGYSIMRKTSQHTSQILARFTKKQSLKPTNSDADVGHVVVECVEISKNSAGSQNANLSPAAATSNLHENAVNSGGQQVSVVRQSNVKVHKPSSTLSISSRVDIKDSLESVNSREMTLVGAHKGDSSHATRKKKKRTARKIFKEVRITKMLFTVVAVFFFCWTPFVIASVLYGLNVTLSNFELMTVAIMLACLNSVCNPVIYALMNKNFRDAFMQLFKKLTGCSCSSETVPEG